MKTWSKAQVNPTKRGNPNGGESENTRLKRHFRSLARSNPRERINTKRAKEKGLGFLGGRRPRGGAPPLGGGLGGGRPWQERGESEGGGGGVILVELKLFGGK